MSFSVNNNPIYSQFAEYNNTKADSIKNTLNNAESTDEELMDACKSFESYMLEQVFKGMKSTVPKSEEEESNDYMTQFGDMLYEEYAQSASEKESIGLAQMLYESMKRNSN